MTGVLGQTVDYEIIVTNAGDVALTFSGFSDAHCDAETIAGGPGATPLQPGESTTYTCSHVLNSVGSYVNEATVTGTPPGEAPITQTSNAVAAVVPAQAAAPIITTTTHGPTGESGVAPFCAINEPATVLRGATGPKRAAFSVQIRSVGIKQITFYLDGRKLKTLKSSQARGGKFTVEINPAKLSYGAHKVTAKTVMSDSSSNRSRVRAFRPPARGARNAQVHRLRAPPAQTISIGEPTWISCHRRVISAFLNLTHPWEGRPGTSWGSSVPCTPTTPPPGHSLRVGAYALVPIA